MTTEPRETENKFIANQNYQFDPPVETSCLPVSGGEWTQKPFAEGWCLKFIDSENLGIFQGKPVGERKEHIFRVEWGKGSVATNVPPPRLRVVES